MRWFKWDFSGTKKISLHS